MATKKLSGSGLAADIRSGMGCVALTEKYDLSVVQLRKALETLVARDILAQNELPPWVAEEKPWTCPKCGRSQSERSPRCPVCGVIIAKLQTMAPDRAPSQQSSSSRPSTPQFSDWTDEPLRSNLSTKIIVGAVAVTCLVVAVIAFRPTAGPQKQLAQQADPQADISADQTVARKSEPSPQDIAYGSLNKANAELLQSTKAQRIAKLAKNYRKTHTYSVQDQFACVDMSIDLWNQIQTAGIRAGLMAGNVQTDITVVRAENFIRYVAEMNHAWVVAEIEAGRWIPVEATAGGIVNPLDTGYWRYFSGEFFTNPAELKQFEEMRRNLFKVCSEAKEMHKNFSNSIKLNQPKTKEAVLEAYRAHGKLEQRAHDCKDLLERIELVLNNRPEKVVPWTSQ